MLGLGSGSDSLTSADDVAIFLKKKKDIFLEEHKSERSPILLNRFLNPCSKTQAAVDINLLHPKGIFDNTNNTTAIFEYPEGFSITQVEVETTEDQFFSLKEAAMFVSSEPIEEEELETYAFNLEKKINNSLQPILVIKMKNYNFKHKFKITNFPTGKYIGFCFIKPQGYIEVLNIKIIGFEGYKKFGFIEQPEDSEIQHQFNSKKKKIQKLKI